jgi:hypothetical protein
LVSWDARQRAGCRGWGSKSAISKYCICIQYNPTGARRKPVSRFGLPIRLHSTVQAVPG